MKILFIHGLASSGAYKMADTLRILLRPCEVIAPDVPIEPGPALDMLRAICAEEKPDLVVGLSLGGFWAQKLRGYRKLLVNPEFHVSRFMRTMIGEVEYLSPRRDGAKSFFITPELCDEYEVIERTEFDGLVSDTPGYDPEAAAFEISLTTGAFATEDELVHCSDEFVRYYPGRRHDYPGRHLPNYRENKEYLLPIIRQILSI